MFYSNPLIYIDIHDSEIPWLKLFTHIPYKEFSECSREEKEMLWECLDLIEKEMLSYFKPEKINIASFGNMVPRVHWHIMARFKEDSYFPEPMWGMKQREGLLPVAPLELFLQELKVKLEICLERGKHFEETLG
ncbi:MAG: HIT family protein [Sulfuricurvum sp.]|jgi:diadenosine tetraphosphate (Ap4A) HIT family hydrolase|uniref:HIT family protein n=1 Tax=Sulfuricurvum sp. TaxID=2025608 RepID=UPI0025DF694D|nr:HIT domain-containing protein [Sulfuricurvum sp.]MCK9373369.1 HIT family protein [Sulfuricurvum sp.]